MSLFESGIRPAIDDYLIKLSKERRDYGNYWSASSAGYCMRKNIFDRLGVDHIESDSDARKQRVFTAGHIFHDWIQGITKPIGLSVAQELELQDEDLMIRGHIDDLVLVPVAPEPPQVYKDGGQASPPKHLILYDYKTVNSRSFMWAKKNDNAMSYYHKMQLGTYMYMLRKGSFEERKIDWEAVAYKTGDTSSSLVKNLTEARILKIEKDTLMMMEQQLLWDGELQKEVLTYWNTLNNYWQSKKLPPCTCADQEGGFMAKEKFNPFYYDGEPCSLAWYEKWKAERKDASPV